MRLALRPKPQTVIERVEAVGAEALEFARSVPERLDTSRKRALAVAGSAAGAAAGLAFWRSRSDDGGSVHQDPAQQPTPWKTPPPQRTTTKKPVTDSKEAAASAAGTRSK